MPGFLNPKPWPIWGKIGIMEKKMELLYDIGVIMEKRMETTNCDSDLTGRDRARG